MKILHIASIFPVKDAPHENPYVQQFVAHYQQAFGGEMEIIKPVSYLPKALGIFKGRKAYWRNKRLICRTKEYTSGGVKITVWPYVSVGSVSNLHAFFSSLVYGRNRRKAKKEYIRSFNLIHAHYLFPDGLIAYQLHKKYGIPYILTLQQELRFLENGYARHLAKKITGHAAAVTTLSPHMAEGLEEKGMKKAQLVPLGIAGYFFEKQEDLAREKENEEKLKLLSVCNFLPVKNLEAVIRAIGQMPDKEKIDYAIYGTGPLEQELKKLAAELQLSEIIHFKGAVENKELPAVMPRYDVFVQPSFKETLGLTYFEALACGLPVIITENTGAYELIKDKEVYYPVDPHRPESIVSCLQGILSDRKTLAHKSARAPEAAKIASWEGFVEFFHKRYGELIRRRAPGPYLSDRNKV